MSKNNGERGVCQVCGGTFATKPGWHNEHVVTRHGWAGPGKFGATTRGLPCPGANKPPASVGAERIAAYEQAEVVRLNGYGAGMWALVDGKCTMVS